MKNTTNQDNTHTDTRNLLEPKAGQRERAERYATETASLQQYRRILEVHQRQV
jgi:hypothetical protein